MTVFQKLIAHFFNSKIVYKFSGLFIAFSIGLAVISYTFHAGLNDHQETFKQAIQLVNMDKKTLANLAQLLKYSKTITADNTLPAENKLNQLIVVTDALTLELDKIKNKTVYIAKIQEDSHKAYQSARYHFFLEIGVLFISLCLISWFIIIRGITKPIIKIHAVINKIIGGDAEMRVNSDYQDEIGRLSTAFDKLLDEKITSLAQTENDHQQLNTSIINLLRAVSLLSQKDLTVRVPVAEDMTGAVSDSINLLTDEIAATLKEVVQISARVNDISAKVKQQSGNVMVFADNQAKEIEATLEELNTAVNTMVRIAQFSQVTNKESEKTMLTTESAVEAVTEIIASINGIRDVIRETEKRIKRLGERSQEITGVVNIINTIAERTHVLSLNAGMQAAAAGEAGKSFMVVANEVQRLAESSREATEKIAALVKNIQVDTSDTMKTMNTVISQVVEGTEQAEEAGRRMKESRATTQSLIAAVKKIAATTIAQLEVGKSLKEHARNIQTSSVKTHEQLQQQRSLSDELAHHAEELIVKVSIFKLPE